MYKRIFLSSLRILKFELDRKFYVLSYYPETLLHGLLTFGVTVEKSSVIMMAAH